MPGSTVKHRRTGSEVLAYAEELVNAWPTSSAVLVADGAGISVKVESGHLVVNDGIAGARRVRKISRIDREIQRLLVLSPSGYISLDSIRWLADAGIPWVQLARHGQSTGIQAMSGPGREDARLLRAQALAAQSDTGMEIARYLLRIKLAAQADVIDQYFPQASSAFIRGRALAIESADTINDCIIQEGFAASSYWQAWEGSVNVPFNLEDEGKVPSHWKSFIQRASLANEVIKNRHASDPMNAMLNLIYKIGEIEAVNSCHAVGLSPVLGIAHTDRQTRDSFALDLLEVVRPYCDRIILDLLRTGEVFPRKWLAETSDGVCRLSPPLTHMLCSHAPALAEILYPHARHVAEIVARESVMPSVPRYKARGPKTATHVGYPAARLRHGVTVAQVCPDEVWQEIAPLIPARKTLGRPPAMTDRTAVAVLTARYVIRCPWAQALALGKCHRSTVDARLRAWQRADVWDKIREVMEASEHLSALAE